MLKLNYLLLFTILFFTLNGCSSQAVSLNTKRDMTNHTAPYSLEALDLRYQQRGY
jgi:hypothetical protein